MPFFSIIIPTYNRGAVLSKAIETVLEQEFHDFELIISDDGSTDDTATKIEVFISDQRIRYLRQENRGVSAARNYGATSANGKYLIFLDSDDTVNKNWLKDYYEMAHVSNADVITCDLLKLFPEGKKLRVDGSLTLLAGAFVIRKELFINAGAYDENIRFGENSELMWRLDSFSCKKKHIGAANLFYNASDNGGRTNLHNRIASFYYLLTKHHQKFTTNPSLAQNYYQVAGVDCIKCGRIKEGRGLLWEGYKQKPLNLKALLRALLSKQTSLMNYFWN